MDMFGGDRAEGGTIMRTTEKVKSSLSKIKVGLLLMMEEVEEEVEEEEEEA